MLYMNDYDIMRAVEFYHAHPVLSRATRTLANLASWTDRNSDGWAYWPKPAKAAEKLMTLIEQDKFNPNPDVTEADYKKALTPIKAFCTKNNVDFLDIQG